MNSIRKSCLIVVCFLVSNVNGELIRQPPGLERGDQYHLAFITSGTRDSSSTNIEDYNAFVQNAADSSPMGDWGLTWLAVGATGSVGVNENLPTKLFEADPDDAPIFLVDGSRLRGSGPWDITEFGVVRPTTGGIQVMTGLDQEGNTASFPLGSGLGVNGGLYTESFPFWYSAGSEATVGGNQNQLPMYAISERLIAVPEPSSGHLLAIAFFVFATFVRRK